MNRFMKPSEMSKRSLADDTNYINMITITGGNIEKDIQLEISEEKEKDDYYTKLRSLHFWNNLWKKIHPKLRTVLFSKSLDFS